MLSSPNDISNLIGWWKADTGVYSDAAKTTPCAVGDLVYTWDNQVVGGADLIQATSGKRPTFGGVAAGYITPTVDSAGDRTMLWTVGPIAQPYTIGVCFLHGGKQDFYSCLVYGEVGTGPQITFQSSATAPYIYAGGSSANSTVACSTSRPGIAIAVYNNTSSTLRIDRQYGYNGSTAVGTGALQNESLFGDSATSYTTKANVYEFVVYSKGLTLAEQQDLEDYFAYTHRIMANSLTGLDGTSIKTPGLYPAIRGIQLREAEFQAVGVRKDTSEGNPSAPCLALDTPNPYRFRWPVRSGARTIQVDAKQVSNVAGKRPKLVVKANAAIGVNADVEGSAAAGTGWVTIGPLNVTPSSDGVLWVEVQNIDTDSVSSPAFFDNIQVT